MLRNFKIEALTPCCRNGKHYLRWVDYRIKAKDPAEALEKCRAKYPGRSFSQVEECWPNWNPILFKNYTVNYIAAHETELKIEYELGVK